MEEKENRKKFSSAGKAIIIISMSISIIIAAANIGVYTWAKYHSEDSGKGVATVSSDFFFLSNTLSSVESISWSDSDISEAEAIDENHKFSYVYTDSDWDATTPCIFNIEMHNYENTLRYNAETIKYTLYAKLLQSPSNPDDSYQLVYYSDDHSRELGRYDLTTDGIVRVEGVTLRGDAASKNYFGLIVNPENSDDYVPANIIVYAEITSPDYAAGDAAYYLGAIFSPQAEKLSFTIDGRFDIEAEIEGGADWIKTLNDLSGFSYTVATDGEAGAEHDIILYWDSTYLNFDLHNSYYTENTVLDNGTYKERIPIEYDGFIERGKVQDLPEKDIIDGYTDYLIYHTVANRNSSFIFYKGENWSTDGKLVDENGEAIISPANYDTFKHLVKAQLH